MEQSNADYAVLEHHMSVIAPHLNRPDVLEVVINRPNELFIETPKGWEKHAIDLPYKACYTLAKAIANRVKQNVSDKSPLLSTKLPDGERVQIVVPEACEQGTVSITIRKPSDRVFSLDDFSAQGMFEVVKTDAKDVLPDDELLLALKRQEKWREFLAQAIKAKKNIIVSGATGSGKTTFMKGLIQLIPSDERIITIEDSPELSQLKESHENRVHLFYSEGHQGVSSVSAKELLKTTLRMKPDRILLAELRGDEAFYFLRNVNSGHPGSITSVHAGSTKAAFQQLVLYIKDSAAGSTMEEKFVQQMLYSMIDIVVQMKSIRGVGRRITEIYFDPVKKNAAL